MPNQQSGRASQGGEIVGLLKLEDYMPAALADSLKAGEEDRRSDHAPARRCDGE